MAKIAFAGDVMIGRGVDAFHRGKSSQIIADCAVRVLKQGDFSVCNLETPVCVAARKRGNMKASPETLAKVGCFDLYGLANNHIFDCGVEGAVETISNLDESGLNWIGLNNGDQIKSFSTVIGGKTFLFVAAMVQRFVDWRALKDRNDGAVRVQILEEELFGEYVSEQAKRVDHVVCLVHGGNERVVVPEPSFRARCQALLDAGASIVITSHPHVLGGYERYRGKYIFYSLGDFVFDNGSFLPRYGAILIFDFTDNSWELVQTMIDWSFQVKLTDSPEKEKYEKRWARNTALLREEAYSEKYGDVACRSLFRYEMDRVYYRFKTKGVLSTLALFYQHWRPIPRSLMTCRRLPR